MCCQCVLKCTLASVSVSKRGWSAHLRHQRGSYECLCECVSVRCDNKAPWLINITGPDSWRNATHIASSLPELSFNLLQTILCILQMPQQSASLPLNDILHLFFTSTSDSLWSCRVFSFYYFIFTSLQMLINRHFFSSSHLWSVVPSIIRHSLPRSLLTHVCTCLLDPAVTLRKQDVCSFQHSLKKLHYGTGNVTLLHH